MDAYQSLEKKIANRMQLPKYGRSVEKQITYRSECIKPFVRKKQNLLALNVNQFKHSNQQHNKHSLKKHIKDDVRDYLNQQREILYTHTHTPSKISTTKVKHFPKNIVDVLYRQNIKNYNPYIAALDQLQQAKNIPLYKKQQISNLAYLGIAKSFLKTKKYSIGPSQRRVNVLIRTYTRDKMCEAIQQKCENQENIIYLRTNQLALSFNPTRYPVEISDICSQDYFRLIVTNVNKIISDEYLSYKSSNSVHVVEPITSQLIGYIIALVVFVYLFTLNIYLLLIIFSLILIYMLVSALNCRQKLRSMVRSQNVTVNILCQINLYFDSLKNDRIEWKIGQDFYWIEIHYIKKKKKNFLWNNDVNSPN